MKYLDRYLEDVKYHLYGKDKNDIIKELKSDILNRLEDNYTEDDLIKVLEDLGAPWEVASSYNYDNDGLTITKENFNNYIKILKLLFVIGFITSAVTAGTVFYDYQRFTFSIDAVKILTYIITTLHQTFNFMVFSIGILTIIFYFIEKHDKKEPKKNKLGNYIAPLSNAKEYTSTKWTIKNLKSKRYNLADYIGGTIAIVFWTVLFLVFLDRQVWPIEYQFFKSEYFIAFAFLVLLSIILEILVNSYRFFKGEKTLMYVALNLFRNAYVIFSSAYILIYKEMFYIPSAISDVPQEIFILVFVINIIIALSSIYMSIYRYIKLK